MYYLFYLQKTKLLHLIHVKSQLSGIEKSYSSSIALFYLLLLFSLSFPPFCSVQSFLQFSYIHTKQTHNSFIFVRYFAQSDVLKLCIVCLFCCGSVAPQLPSTIPSFSLQQMLTICHNTKTWLFHVIFTREYGSVWNSNIFLSAKYINMQIYFAKEK